MNWHALSEEEVIAILKSDGERGLSVEEAQKRLREYGRN
ncbi:MAG: cation-transporting P-type ATPase, partial [Candidatus Caldatribacteriaceae bacterium]